MNSDKEGLTQPEFNAKYAPWREITELTDDEIRAMSNRSVNRLIARISREVTHLVKSHINDLRNKA